jgi:N-acetylneuraminic acid mutarotase
MRGILVLAYAALVASGCGDGGGAAGAGSWQRTVAPANGLSGLDAVRIGDKVVVVGGADYDGTEVKALVLDLESGRWTRAARSRLPSRGGHSVVTAGDELIVWGGSHASAAAYHAARDAWRRIRMGPLARRFGHSAVWTGADMIVWGGQWGRRARRDGAAYDPRARRWRRIARGPLAPRADHAAAWTGREMIVWGGSRPARSGRARVLSDGAAYDPARDAWRRIASVPLRSAPVRLLGRGAEVGLDAVWTGTSMLVWNGFVGAAYAPRGDRWTLLPPPPPRLRHWKPTDSAVWTGRRLIVFGGTASHTSGDFIADSAAYDPARARWSMLPPAPLAGRDRHAAVWTGDAMLVWGGCCRGSRHHRDGALYRPR